MLESTYHIQRAQEAEITIIHDLASRIWKKTYEPFISGEQIEYMFDLMYSVKGLLAQLKESNHQFFVIYRQEVPIGFASISMLSNLSCRIHKLYILQELQGQNAGRIMLTYIEELARQNGVSAMELNVNRYNQNAILFYKKVGFLIKETVDIPLANFMLNDYVMTREVKS